MVPSRSSARHGVPMARPHHTGFAAIRAVELRNDLTVSEAHLWSALKTKQTGVRFRRQVPIGRWIADFACFDPRLVIEVDDTSHDYRDESKRNADLAAEGFAILRFDNKEIAQDLNAAFNSVVFWIEHIRQHGHPPE
jgi:very-short-patch-repair endonuclease